MEPRKEEGKKGDIKEAPKKDLLAELDIAGLFKSRGEAAEKEKEARERADNAKALHFVACVIGGCMSMVAVIHLWSGELIAVTEPTHTFLLAACVVLGLGLWTATAFPSATVLRLQNEAAAAARHLKSIDDKIAFCNVVMDEAKRVKVRKYAEAWVQKELS